MTAWLSQLNIRTIFDLEKAPDSPALRKRLRTALGGSTLAPGESIHYHFMDYQVALPTVPGL